MTRNEAGRLSQKPVTVVGGGIAGLVAAISTAEKGNPVQLYEARGQLGGRARSADGPWAANFGPHALCSARTNWSWLKERGLLPTTARISPVGSSFHFGGKLHRLRPPLDLRWLVRPRQAPVDASFSEWASVELGVSPALTLSRLAASSFSYHHDPGELSAAFVWDRLRWLFVPPAVHRIVGGWSVLIEALDRRARELGVVIKCHNAIDRLPAAPVILAIELRDASKLLGREISYTSAGGVALDVAVESRRRDPLTIIDLDDGVLIQAQHLSAAPAGRRLYQAHVGIKPGESQDGAQRRIERVLDNSLAEWRERVAWRRRLVVADRTGAVDYPGKTWMDRPDIVQGDGVFLAGDMVAAPGLLSEVAFNSAITAARSATAI